MATVTVPSGPLARRLFLGRIIGRRWLVLGSALGKVTALKRRRRPGSGDFLRRTGRTRKPGRLNDRHCAIHAQNSHNNEFGSLTGTAASLGIVKYPEFRARFLRPKFRMAWPRLLVMF